MAKRHLAHIRSKVIVNDEAKLPLESDLVYGEIAINYAKDHETISLKNDENEIVPLNFKKINDAILHGVSGMSINNIDAEVEDRVASVVISGSDINVGDYTEIEYPSELEGAVNVSGTSTISEGFNAVETTLSALTQEVIDNEVVTEKAIAKIADSAGIIDEEGEIKYITNENATYISSAISLSDADNKLDAAIASLADSVDGKIENINVNGQEGTVSGNVASVTIDATDMEVGEYTPISYPEAFSGATQVLSGDTVNEAFNKVETTISSLTQEVLDNEQVTEKAIKALGEAAGTIDENNVISYVVNENANYISAATSLAEADDILDAAIGNSITGVSVNEIQAEVENRNAAISISGNNINVGTYESVEYPQQFTAATNVSGDQAISEAINAVESTLATLTQVVIDDERVTEEAIKALGEATGTINENNEIAYVVNENAHYINGATSLTDADNLLDAALDSMHDEIDGTLTGVTVNSVQATVENRTASLDLYGKDITTSSEYSAITYPSELVDAQSVETGDTLEGAFNKVETTISALTKEVLDNEEVTEEAIKALGEAAGTIDENNVITYVVNENANYISAATSLANADDILDAQIHGLSSSMLENVQVNDKLGTITDKISSIELDSNDIEIGAYSAITYPSGLTAATPIESADTVNEGFNAVETTISALTQEVLDNERVTEEAIKALGEAAGTIDENNVIAYVVNENANYINGATSLSDADNKLDNAIKSVSNTVNGKLDNINVNGQAGTVENGIASTVIDATNIAVGEYTPTEYDEAFTGATPITSADTVNEGLKSIETTVSNLTNELILDELVTSKSVKALGEAAGTIDENDTIKYIVNENANYIDDAVSLADADNILDMKIKYLENLIEVLTERVAELERRVP